MTIKIHKFGPITDKPRTFSFAGPLKAGIQDDLIQLWASAIQGVNFEYEVVIVGTGHPFPEGFVSSHYVDTVFDDQGFVWHVLARQVS